MANLAAEQRQEANASRSNEVPSLEAGISRLGSMGMHYQKPASTGFPTQPVFVQWPNQSDAPVRGTSANYLQQPVHMPMSSFDGPQAQSAGIFQGNAMNNQVSFLQHDPSQPTGPILRAAAADQFAGDARPPKVDERSDILSRVPASRGGGQSAGRTRGHQHRRARQNLIQKHVGDKSGASDGAVTLGGADALWTNRRFVKVGGESNPKAVAGAIAHQTRAGQPPVILASGSHSINQSIKAIAICRGYLQDDGVDISAQPEFRESHGTAVSFDIEKSKRISKVIPSTEDLKVAGTSDPNIVAGAIAGKIRGSSRVTLQAIGPSSVLHAVEAIAIARRYLENDGLDIRFRSEFIEVVFQDGVRNAIRFSLLLLQV